MVEVRYTAVFTRVLRVLIIALLCVGVFLQILGAAVAFWDVDGSDDPFISSILTSFAVLGNESVFLVLLQCLLGVAMIRVSLPTASPGHAFPSSSLLASPALFGF